MYLEQRRTDDPDSPKTRYVVLGMADSSLARGTRIWVRTVSGYGHIGRRGRLRTVSEGELRNSTRWRAVTQLGE